MPDRSAPNLTRVQLRQLQIERLQVVLNRAYFNVDLYRQRMDELNVLPEDFSTLELFRRFPFTTRDDLIANYPYGLFAVPLRDIVRLKMATPSLGQRGGPVVVGFTRHDVRMWQDLMVRLYERLGVTDRDIIQVAFNFSLFPGAFTFNHGAETLGATLAPSATISAVMQLQIMKDFRSTVLATTSAFALHIAGTMESSGICARDLSLKMVLLGPEPLPELTRQRIENILGAPVYGLYGVTEMVEPGLAGECPARDGLHLADDQFLAEIVHPVSGEPVPPGNEGELVLTTLSAEGYPLIRYRTGDVTIIKESACSCGRSSSRMVPVLRRTDDRISIRGISFYPDQIEELLRSIDPSFNEFRVVVQTSFGIGDSLEILLTRSGKGDSDLSRNRSLEKMRSQLRRVLGLGARISFVEPERLPREGLIRNTVFRSSGAG